MTHSEPTWTSAANKARPQPISKLSHQHLSNIIHFNTIFWNNPMVNHPVQYTLEKLYNNILLPWKPLPVSQELETLYKSGILHTNGDLIFRNKKIGSITHLKNWQEYIS